MSMYQDDILQWLYITDPYVNHNAARAKCEPKTETGSWFIHGEEYRRWKEQPSSFLWLYSIPGGGKTILWRVNCFWLASAIFY